ncbi:MAG: BatA domain-containing protein [Pirellulales bacterium]
MSTLSFLSQPLLWGLALASIPLIIHLLYRRQYRRIDWAPMRYLKLSIQRNRRRVRIEQLLLLLLRTVIVLVLFLAVARPMMHAAGLSRLWGGGSRTSRIVLLDDSLSMGYAEEGKAALARGQELVADLFSTFGAKDRLTVVLASQPRQPLVREIELENAEEIVQLIREVQPKEILAAWLPIFKEIDALVAGGSYPLHEVTLITDLRRAGWEERLADLGDRWAGQHVELRVLDLGANQTQNVALVGLRQVDRLALAAVPTRFEALVRNDTLGELGELEANLVIDGKSSLVRVPPIPPGETARVPLASVFQDPGAHHVAFELPADALPGDNARRAVVHVQQAIEIQLVDGEPSAEALGSETDFLALALSLSGEIAEPFRVEIISDAQWASTPTARPDLLVFANVPRVSEEQAELLERMVAEGMGLMIFVGDATDPDNYNLHLFKNGAGLLGASLEGISDIEFSGLLVESAEGSPLEAVGQLSPAALQRIKVRKTYELKLPGGDVEGVRVLARWNNAGAAPAVVQKTFGRGQTLLWTISADRAWSDWPTEASYVLAMREVTRAIAKSAASLRDVTAGQALKIELPASHDISLPAIAVPGQKEPQPLVAVAAKPAGEGGAAATQKAQSPTLQYDDTRLAGLYTMTWRDSVSGEMNEMFAVNPDPRESALARLDRAEFKALWGALEPEVVSVGSANDASLSIQGQELWRTLATCMFGLLMVEACFARWCGRPR